MQDSPLTKRVKLESEPPESLYPDGDPSEEKEEQEDVENQCSICLQRLTDRTLIPRCSHEFCFECLVIWTDQSRRCPLCAQGIGGYLIHNIRSKYDYTKYFLPPLRSNSPTPFAVAAGSSSSNQRRPRRERRWGQRERRAQEEQDQLERSIKRRRWVYRHHLYAKHVAANVHTRYKPFPTPAQFAASPDHISRAAAFLRRELQVWPNLDIEFLTTFTLSIMKSLDIRSESTVKLLSEFLDMDQPYVEGDPHPNAEHFAHEMYSYLRSPFRDLYVYDKMVQYDEPGDPPSQPQIQGDNMGIGFRPSSPSRHSCSPPRRPDNNYGDDGRREVRGASGGRRRKRSRSGSHDRGQARQLRDPGADERPSRRARSECQTLPGSSGSLPPVPHSQVVKGKGKAVDLRSVANGRDEDERARIDKRVHELPDAEHTVIDDSKCGRGDRAPKVLSLRQSVQAHLSLRQTEPLKVSRHDAGSERRILGPDPRHGRPSLLERISGMEDVSQSHFVSVSTLHLALSAGPDPARSPRSAAIKLAQSRTLGGDTDPTKEYAVAIDSHHPDPIPDLAHQDNPTAQFDCPDRATRVNTKDVLERTRVRLAKMKNAMVAEIPPTAPTPPPIPIDPSTPTEPGGTTPSAPIITTMRNKLLERLESERMRAVGAACREPGAEPIVGNISERSLKAELRARSQLRARFATVNADCHVGSSEP